MPSVEHEAAVELLHRNPPGRRADYTRVIRDTASEAARHALEELMKTVFRDEFIDGLLDQGRAEGEAQMLLRVLDARGFSVPGHVRERVTSCTDTAQLEAWGDKAATAASLEEIFGSYSPEADPSGT
jgi:hypothetical protein